MGGSGRPLRAAGAQTQKKPHMPQEPAGKTLEPASKTLSSFSLSLNILPAGKEKYLKGPHSFSQNRQYRANLEVRGNKSMIDISTIIIIIILAQARNLAASLILPSIKSYRFYFLSIS